MNNFFLKGAMVILTLLNTKAFAAEMDKMFYWSNAKGLVAAENCKLVSFRNPHLGLIKADRLSNSVTLEKNQGLSNLKIVSGSIVKLGDIQSETEKRSVEVVGVNGIFDPLEVEAIRGDDGVVNLKNIESISKRFIQIKVDYLNVIGGTFWKVYGKDKFLKLNCPEFQNTDDYLVFSVYPKDGGRMLARVGVSASETELFKNVYAFQESKILNKFSDAVTDESNSLSEIEAVPEYNSLDVKDVIIPPVIIDIPPIDDTEIVIKDPVTTQVGMDTIICTDQNYINIRNEDLSQVIFTAKNGNRVKIFQGWGDNKVEGTINGKKYIFIKVEFLDTEDNAKKIGYVVSSFVEPKSSCVYEPSYRDNLKPENTSFTGLDDKDCCNFPTLKKVTTSFTDGMRRFGGSRGGGTRAHAAADLYRYIDEPIYSVAPGVVIRSLYFFYQGTFALEVLHSGGFVVRYGELTGKIVNNVSIGKQVKMGDRLGFIGKVNSGCCEPMLHFELYSGKLKGPLTQEGAEVNGILYSRRRDLMNPTKYLLKWQNAKF